MIAMIVFGFTGWECQFPPHNAITVENLEELIIFVNQIATILLFPPSADNHPCL